MTLKRRGHRFSSVLDLGITVLFGVSTGAFAAAQWVVGLAAFIGVLLLARAAEA